MTFNNTYYQLPQAFHSPQKATPVPHPQAIALNEQLAQELNIPQDWLHSPEALNTFAGNHTPDGAQPTAQAYSGHQFANFNPQLGDGRALLLGELVDRHGNQRDIQLKGSGPTPYSRRGDGKSALGPVLREYLVSEAMHRLGVPTTRALAALSTGENVLRQEGNIPGGILTRVAASHIRVGTFQHFYARQDQENLKILTDYAIERHYPQAAQTDNPALALLQHVISAQAQLISHWMSLGFIHGVMNTDNFTISGQTLDYGPCAFQDTFHPKKTFSSIDRDSRYAWGNQANIGLWNLSRFAETLLTQIHPEHDHALSLAKETLASYGPQFNDHYHRHYAQKLGLDPKNPQLQALTTQTLTLLTETEQDYTQFFTALTHHAQKQHNPDQDTHNPQDKITPTLETLFQKTPEAHQSYQDWHKTWLQAHRDQQNPQQAATTMAKTNPRIIPRNHRVEEAIAAAYNQDHQPFHDLHAALQNPYTPTPDQQQYQTPPTPDQQVHQTFCGT